jgi:hypothetical protein
MIRVALSTCCLLPFFLLPPSFIPSPIQPRTHGVRPATRHPSLVTRHFVTPSLHHSVTFEDRAREPCTRHLAPDTRDLVRPHGCAFATPFGGFVSKMKPSLWDLGVRGDEGPHPRPRGLFPFLRLANPVYFPSLGQEGINEGGRRPSRRTLCLSRSATHRGALFQVSGTGYRAPRT